MYTCMVTRMSTYMETDITIHIHAAHMHTYMQSCSNTKDIYTYVNTCMQTYMYTQMYLHKQLDMHPHMHMWHMLAANLYIHVHTLVPIHVLIQVHVHGFDQQDRKSVV